MIEKILTLSTGHMPNPEPDFGKFRTVGHEYGAMVFLTALEDGEGVPEWMLPICRAAEENGCVAILFDRDVPVEETFPSFDW